MKHTVYLGMLCAALLVLGACSSDEATGLRDASEYVLDASEGALTPGSEDDLNVQGSPTLIDDAQALRGRGFIFMRTDDQLTWNRAMAAGSYEVFVTARAEPYNGDPQFELTIGEAKATKAFSNTSYQTLSFGTFEVADDSQVKLRYTNDFWGGSDATDRNIVLSHISVRPVASATPLPEPNADPATSRRNEFLWSEKYGDYLVNSWASSGHEGTNYLEWNDPLTFLYSEFSSTAEGQNGWVGYQKTTTPGYPKQVSTMSGPVTVGFTREVTNLNVDPSGARIFVGTYGWNHDQNLDWGDANGWQDEWYVWSWSNADPMSVRGGLEYIGAETIGSVNASGKSYSLYKMERNYEFSGMQWHAVPDSWDGNNTQIDVLPILNSWKQNGMRDYMMLISVGWETFWGANSATIALSNLNLPRF